MSALSIVACDAAEHVSEINRFQRVLNLLFLKVAPARMKVLHMPIKTTRGYPMNTHYVNAYMLLRGCYSTGFITFIAALLLLSDILAVIFLG